MRGENRRVLVEGFTILLRDQAIEESYRGGLGAFLEAIHAGTTGVALVHRRQRMTRMTPSPGESP